VTKFMIIIFMNLRFTTEITMCGMWDFHGSKPMMQAAAF
jgi:hypothetical protein